MGIPKISKLGWWDCFINCGNRQRQKASHLGMLTWRPKEGPLSSRMASTLLTSVLAPATTPSSMYHAWYKRWTQPHHPCTTRDGHNPIIHVPCVVQEMAPIIHVPCTIQEMGTTPSSMHHKRWAQPHHPCTTRDGHNPIIHVPCMIQEMGTCIKCNLSQRIFSTKENKRGPRGGQEGAKRGPRGGQEEAKRGPRGSPCWTPHSDVKFPIVCHKNGCWL